MQFVIQVFVMPLDFLLYEQMNDSTWDSVRLPTKRQTQTFFNLSLTRKNSSFQPVFNVNFRNSLSESFTDVKVIIVNELNFSFSKKNENSFLLCNSIHIISVSIKQELLYYANLAFEGIFLIF